jgi:hypothetical protein
MKNILDLKIDELAADAAERVNILLKVLNSFSSRFFSFIDPALLGSPGKSVEMSQDSS